MNTNQIKAAEVGATLWDDKVRGLHLRVFAQRKAFYLYFRTKAGKERRPKIGEWPGLDIISAREAAQKYLRELALGIDPIEKRQLESNRLTMEQLADRYMDRHGKGKKSASMDARLIRQHILPRFGKRYAADIKHIDVDDYHRELEDKPILANRLVALLSKMFNLAEKWEVRPLNSNPCRHLKRYPEKKRHRYLAPDEAVAIWEALEHYGASHPASVAFIKLLIFTGARKGEIASARWDWLEGNRLRLPDSKTGKKTIRLPQQALDVLAALPRTSGTLTGISDPRKTWQLVLARAKVNDLTIHDLRHSFASVGISVGQGLSQIGELLGHASPNTTKRYAHLMEDHADAAAQQIADELELMMREASNRKRPDQPGCELESVPSLNGSERPDGSAE